MNWIRTTASVLGLRGVVLVLITLWLNDFWATASAQQEIVTLATRPGVTQSYFLTSAPKELQAAAILFAGSGGLIHLRTENGQTRFGQGNFLVRSRSEFVKRGVIAAIVDAPLDQQGGWGMSDEFRLGNDHYIDIAAIVSDLSRRIPGAPLYLIGTSRGSTSAAALGARFGSPVAGVILTSTMFRQAGRKANEPGVGLSKFDFATIKSPVLLVHHVSDQCEFTPYSDAARLSERYPLITVFGGKPPKSGPCDAFSQHGFFGKEAETVEQIVNWMNKKPIRETVK